MQIIICAAVSYAVAAFDGVSLDFGGVLAGAVAYFPVVAVMTALGILFGSILSDKSAPGISSAVITVSAVLGGAWMPLETMGSLETVCGFLPWYPEPLWAEWLSQANTKALRHILLRILHTL